MNVKPEASNGTDVSIQDSEITGKVIDAQVGRYVPPAPMYVADQGERRAAQGKFFAELRSLKLSTDLSIDQQEFACKLVEKLQKNDIAVLNKLMTDCTLSVEDLVIAVAAAAPVLNTVPVKVTVPGAELAVELAFEDYENVIVRGGDSQFDCTTTVQDETVHAIAEKINNLFVMY